MAELLQIGLESWIIADGNYTDFSVGDVRSFALAYHDETPLEPASAPPSHRYLADARHAVCGRRFHLGGLSEHPAPTWCVIDIGILAYRELLSFPPPPAGFSGEIYLGVDPFFYFESLTKETDAPPLIYDWRIHRIEVETAPRVLRDGRMIYDSEKLKWAEVTDTTKGESFILHCERLPGPPRRHPTHR